MRELYYKQRVWNGGHVDPHCINKNSLFKHVVKIQVLE